MTPIQQLILETWAEKHIDNPVPSGKDTTQLAAVTGLTEKQVGEWFDELPRRFQALSEELIDPESKLDIAFLNRQVEQLIEDAKKRKGVVVIIANRYVGIPVKEPSLDMDQSAQSDFYDMDQNAQSNFYEMYASSEVSTEDTDSYSKGSEHHSDDSHSPDEPEDSDDDDDDDEASDKSNVSSNHGHESEVISSPTTLLSPTDESQQDNFANFFPTFEEVAGYSLDHLLTDPLEPTPTAQSDDGAFPFDVSEYDDDKYEFFD